MFGVFLKIYTVELVLQHNTVALTKCFHKPTINRIERCLWQLKFFCNEFGVKKLAMPLIACGLDKQP
ncbi:hypothetical protein B566_EDAN011176 [Ephemera danica]|nr:hypothetical protein B566_EDAN011176 [Ephemera danica]